MSARWLVSLALAGLLSSACGGHATCAPGDATCALRCGHGIDSPPIEGHLHVDPPATVSYRANPPASGNHYPVPADWGLHADPVQPEQWVHNLEHGGIVLLYDCPSGCDAEVQQLDALRTSRPVDEFREVRILITPYTAMQHKFAAVAWGWRWQGDTVDETAIRCFIDARYDRGPEQVP
jgi:hypothetical protein